MRAGHGLKHFVAVLVVIACFSTRWVAAETIDPEEITCGGEILGYLTINQYHADNPTDTPPKYPGATLEATFSQQDPSCNLNLHWIQAIVGGVGTIGQTLAAQDNVADPIPYLDPYKRDDNLPYYWTEAENGQVGDGRSGPTAAPGTHLYDAPTQGTLGASIANNSIHFESALVAVDCIDPMKLYWLAGFTWGYTVDGTGMMSTADPFMYRGGPSAALNKAVTEFDGTQNYVGDGNDTMTNNAGGSAGYFFGEGCPECCTPLPNTASTGLLCLAAVGVVKYARRSRYARAA